MVTKARLRRPGARLGYKAGYAWAESGRSLNDLEVVMDWFNLELPADKVTPESLAKEGALYKKMRDEIFEEGELAKLEKQSEYYQVGWWDGVVAFCMKELRKPE
jgi:hypothetical protein